MPEYRFDILCINDHTCDIVMNGMKQKYINSVQKITNPKDRNNGDHYVKLTCDDIDDADMKSREMIQKYSNYIRTITIKPL